MKKERPAEEGGSVLLREQHRPVVILSQLLLGKFAALRQ